MNRIRSAKVEQKGDGASMRKQGTVRFISVAAIAMVVMSVAFASGASAAPAWKFDGSELKGSETILGGAVESSLTVPGLTTKCENFLYRMSIENGGGTGKGSLTELPLFNCTTNSSACTVEAIEAEKLPWASHLTTVSTSNYIVIEGVRVAILYGGEECALNETLATVTGSAGGLISNASETASFNSGSFSATGTKLSALGSTVQWNGLFPTEAFQWHRNQALTAS